MISLPFIPDRVETLLDGFCLLLLSVSVVRHELDLDIWVAEAIRVHGYEIAGLYDCIDGLIAT